MTESPDTETEPVPPLIGIGDALIRPADLHAAIAALRAAGIAVAAAGGGAAIAAAAAKIEGIGDALRGVLVGYLTVDGVPVPAGWESV